MKAEGVFSAISAASLTYVFKPARYWPIAPFVLVNYSAFETIDFLCSVGFGVLRGSGCCTFRATLSFSDLMALEGQTR